MMNVKALFKSRPERDALHAAIAARDAAVKTLEAKRDNESRLEAIVIAYDDCQRAATAALREEKEARTRSVRQGGSYAKALELKALEEKASDAQRLAERAAFDADVAREELRATTATVKEAEHDLRNAEAVIDREIGLVLVREFEPALKRLERIAAEYRAARIEVAGMHDFIYSVATEGERRITQSLIAARALVKELPDLQLSPGGQVISQPPDEVLALTQAWRQRAALLRSNPNAE